VAKPLRVGDVCYSEARIASVTNTDAGKVVKVKGHVYRTDVPVVEVVSAFLYRDRFTWTSPSFMQLRMVSIHHTVNVCDFHLAIFVSS
jgi:hypothetical protein